MTYKQLPYKYDAMRNTHVRDDSKLIDALIERTDFQKEQIRDLEKAVVFLATLLVATLGLVAVFHF